MLPIQFFLLPGTHFLCPQQCFKGPPPVPCPSMALDDLHHVHGTKSDPPSGQNWSIQSSSLNSSDERPRSSRWLWFVQLFVDEARIQSIGSPNQKIQIYFMAAKNGLRMALGMAIKIVMSSWLTCQLSSKFFRPHLTCQLVSLQSSQCIGTGACHLKSEIVG